MYKYLTNFNAIGWDAYLGKHNMCTKISLKHLYNYFFVDILVLHNQILWL